MLDNTNDYKSLIAENADLRRRLEEAEETLGAIRDGHVEALIIGDQVYTLESADSASNRFRGEVLAQINDLVIAVDPEFRIIYMNDAAERVYGVASSDVLGLRSEKILEVRLPDGGGLDEVRQTLKEEGFWRGEMIHFPKVGAEFYVEAVISKLDDGDSLLGFLAVIRDITERKRAENDLQQAHLLLEDRVEQRTAELRVANAALNQEMRAKAIVERQRTDLLRRIVTTQEDERRRIARDIHDQLGQRVTALRLQIASIEEEMSGFPSKNGTMDLLKKTAVRLDSEVSFLAWALRPAALDDLGLPVAAKAFLDDWTVNYKISSEFNLRGFSNRRIRAEAETHLYRIMQEALNNIVKHAKATTVSVLLEWNDDDVLLIVEDNGSGFSLERFAKGSEPQMGLGLSGMRERAILVGGEMQIESAPGGGTTVYVRVPHLPTPPVRRSRTKVHSKSVT